MHKTAQNTFRIALLLICVLTPIITGCGPGRKARARAAVSGKVMLGDKPLQGGMITFTWADDPRDSATIYIRGDGTYETKSAPVGNCKISVRTAHLNPMPNQTAPKPGDPVMPPPKPAEYYVALSGDPKTGKVYMPIPKKYEDINTSGLTFEVGSGNNTHDIKLDEK